MAKVSTKPAAPTRAELEQMHAVYRQGGGERQMAPHVVYSEPKCPYPGCEQPMQAIDFRLEAHGKPVHDPLVRAWWDDTGLAGRCPRCGGWLHFTIRGKLPITEQEAAHLPQLPDNWAAVATIL
jgi:hypothetical protein